MRDSACSTSRKLRRLKLVKRTIETVDAPLAPNGSTVHMHYALTGNLGYTARKALQARAAKATQKRQKKLQNTAPAQGTAQP